METVSRKPFQGVTNIILFNWHFYVIAVIIGGILIVCNYFIGIFNHFVIQLSVILGVLAMFLSLAISWYVYDYSKLYTLNWLNQLNILPGKRIININAGFDETSAIIAAKFKPSSLKVLDFYDPGKHTEVSIARARKKYAAYPDTLSVNTIDMELKSSSADYIFAIFSAHEIRNRNERIDFFKQLHNAVTNEGKVIILEHLRDLNNFMAYNIGFLHFYSKAEWCMIYRSAGLNVYGEIRITPFLTAFILQKNGSSS